MMSRAICLLAILGLGVGGLGGAICLTAWGGDVPAKAAAPAPASATPASSPAPASPGGQVVILKFDDVVQNADANQPAPAGWLRMADYVEKNNIKAGFGILCESLEKDNKAYFDWIKERQKNGIIEFWLHGYRRRGAEQAGEFETGTAAEQAAILVKSETLAKEKLGFSLTAFGEHYSGVTVETEKAMETVPEIKVWLYGPRNSKNYTRLSIPRVMGLEHKTFQLDLDKFKAAYEKVGAKEKVLVLQGHANAWDATRFETFTKIIDFLKAKNSVFMTPSEYLKTVPAKGP